MKKLWIVTIFLIVTGIVLAQSKVSPSFEEVISLKSISNPQISPDGKLIGYLAL